MAKKESTKKKQTFEQALAELEFLACDAAAEGKPCTCRPGQVQWFLTNSGMVAAELLWFDRHFDDPSRLFRALGGG